MSYYGIIQFKRFMLNKIDSRIVELIGSEEVYIHLKSFGVEICREHNTGGKSTIKYLDKCYFYRRNR